MRRVFAGFVLWAAFSGCGSTQPTPSASIPIDPLARPGAQLVLTFDGRDNSPVILRIGSVDIAHFGCNAQAELTPETLPPLPWDLQVIRQGDRQVLLATRVTSLPKWILMLNDNTTIGVGPVLGPIFPSCPPSS